MRLLCKLCRCVIFGGMMRFVGIIGMLILFVMRVVLCWLIMIIFI